MKKQPVRAQAAKIITKVLEGDSLAAHMTSIKQAKDSAFLQMLCFGVLRHIWVLDAALHHFLQKPFKERDLDVQALLLTGLFDLCFSRTADYAVISETVASVQALGKQWAKGLVNAVLRNCQRELAKQEDKAAADVLLAIALQENSEDQDELIYNHPQWLIDQLKQDWPEHWQAILVANNQQALMSLRVNKQFASRQAFLEELAVAAQACPYNQQGISLEKASDVKSLPGFAAGSCFVQDNAAQLAAELLDVQNGQHILDACAAPGGKTTHILELAPEANLLAVDSSASRLQKVEENLQRLKQQAICKATDVAHLAESYQGELFDRILLDVPCSATGVIRRHPDIKLLREAADIEELAAQQQHLLKSVWPLLKSGGLLLYSTCSILKAENAEVVQAFITQETSATAVAIEAEWGLPQTVGRQILPGQDGMDGFYYCLLRKN